MAPCRIEIMRALADAEFQAGDWSMAIAQYRRVLAWDAGDAKARSQLDRALAEQARR